MCDETHLLQGQQNFAEWNALLQSCCLDQGILDFLKTPPQTQSCESGGGPQSPNSVLVTNTTVTSNYKPFCTSTASIRSSKWGDVIRKKRTYRKAKAREVRWTKASRYNGQATFDLKNNMDRVKEAKSAELVNDAPNLGPSLRRDTHNAHQYQQQSNHVTKTSLNGPESQISNGSVRDRFPTNSSTVPNDFYHDFNTFMRTENLYSEDPESGISFNMTQDSNDVPAPDCSSRIVEDVKDIYQTLMSAKADALQWLELWHHSKSIDWWYPLFNAMYALLKLHQTIFEYANHPSASPALQKLLEKYAMAPSLWQTCVHDFMHLVKNSNPGQGTLADIERYLQDTKAVIASLQQGLRHLNEHWESYQSGLDHYLDCLDQIREGRTDWNHPEVFLGDAHANPTVSSTMYPADRKDKIEAENLGHPGMEFPASSNSLIDTNTCSEVAAAALTGWTVFGQGIADTFDYYSRMFKMLSWTSLPDAVRKFTDFLQRQTLISLSLHE